MSVSTNDRASVRPAPAGADTTPRVEGSTSRETRPRKAAVATGTKRKRNQPHESPTRKRARTTIEATEYRNGAIEVNPNLGRGQRRGAPQPEAAEVAEEETRKEVEYALMTNREKEERCKEEEQSNAERSYSTPPRCVETEDHFGLPIVSHLTKDYKSHLFDHVLWLSDEPPRSMRQPNECGSPQCVANGGNHRDMSDNAPASNVLVDSLELSLDDARREHLPKENANLRKQGQHEPRNVEYVVFGGLKFKAQYAAEYPSELIGAQTEIPKTSTLPTLFVCEKCFAYTRHPGDSLRHAHYCSQKIVPGDTIYDHKGEGVWKVRKLDGASPDHKLLLQRLSMFAKMYIDSKSVLYEVWNFDYYLLTHTNSQGDEQIVGYFSKEKASWNNFNLACILILPPWQKNGLGNILGELSYEISRRKGEIGGPERPISEVGHMGYMRLWGKKICKYLLDSPLTETKIGSGEKNIKLISEATGVSPLDCLDFFETLQKTEMPDGPQMLKMKTKRGAHEDYTLSNKYHFEYDDKSWLCAWTRNTMSVNSLVIDQDAIRKWLAKRNIDVNEVVVDPQYVTME
jgi:hypothetical protein